jgi:hypothetical protein
VFKDMSGGVMIWWKRWRNRDKRKLVYNQLQWQRFLLRAGRPAAATIIDVDAQHSILPGWVQLDLFAMIKVNEKILMRQVQTVVTVEKIPAIGDTLQIRYAEENQSCILILNKP